MRHGSRTAQPPPRGFFEITSASLGQDLHSLTQKSGADFVVIGMLVPTNEGLALCDSLRKQGVSDSTVLMLRNIETNAASGSPDANDLDDSQPIYVGEIAIVPGRHEVTVNDRAVELTRTELRMLTAMARKPGWVFSREKLISVMHGGGHACTERTIDVHITSLRRKLGEAAQHIETIRGFGYRFNL